MHELSVVDKIIKEIIKIKKEKKKSQIKSITLVNGKMSGFDSESINFCFLSLIKNTSLNQVKLNIETEDIEFYCNDCKKQSKSDDIFFQCSCCQSLNVKMIKGKSFLIKKILFF